MLDSAVVRYQNVRETSQALMSDISSARRKVKSSKELVEDYQIQLTKLQDEFSIHVEAVEILKKIIEKKSEDHLKNLTYLLTLAMKTIFFDRDYSIEIEVDEKRGANSAQFFLIERKGDKVIRSPLDGGTGGSIRAIVGFVLQIFYIRYFKLSPIVYIDEAFGSISESYIPTLMEFMRQLSELRGFVFVWITHDLRVTPYADKIYRVEAGTVKELKVNAKDI